MGVRLPLLGVPMGGSRFGAGSKVYGATWNKSTSPVLTRTDNAVGMIAAAGVDATPVSNDFDTAEIFSEFADAVDADGNVFRKIPKFYIEKIDTPTALTWRISKRGGGRSYLPACFWDFTNNRELDWIYVGKYVGSLNGGKLQSKPSTYPAINQNIVQFRSAAQANGPAYQQIDIHVADLLQVLMWIEFATLDLQSIMYGFAGGQYSATHTATVTESGVNRIIVANATAALYEVGQAISVGTSLGGNQVFYGRSILGKTVYDASNTAISFDGAAVNIAAGDILYNTGWLNGFSGGIAATSGSLTSNSTGKYPCHYRGIENPYGNVWQFVDGLNINEFQSWVCRNAANYASNLFAAPYEQLSYVNHNANGYTTAMGYDPARPWAALPTAVSASHLSYKDYYYQSTGQRIALLGGYWYSGPDGGPAYWNLVNTSSYAGVYFGARLLTKAL